MPVVKDKNQLTKEEESRLQQVYYNVSSVGSYGGLAQLARTTNLPRTKVQNWLKQQTTYSLHRPVRKRFPRRKYVVRKMDSQHQADLVEMQPFSRENQGYRYMLTLIDVFSRYAWAEPLKRKTAVETANVLRNIYENNVNRIPNRLQTDSGKEFENRDVRQYLSSIGVEQFSLASPMKAAIVERFNRTLKEKMWRIFTKRGTYKWIDILPNLIKSYNNSPHRGLKNMSPSEVSKENEADVWLRQYGGLKKPTKRDVKFNVGDRVKISKAKTVFEKGYVSGWSEEDFFINAIDMKYKPVMYELRDMNNEIIRGKFYPHELQAVINKDSIYRIEKVIRRKGKQALVKFKGYKEPEWIPYSNIKRI